MPLNVDNLTHYPYASGRRVVLGQRGAIATSQPLATLAGLEMFWAGGNAVDAAVATAIALTVVEPTSNGIGGDTFALVWDGQLHGLNASGKSPQALSLSQFEGMSAVPSSGWLGVTVPGAVSAWYALWQRWGRLPFEQLFEPAIRYAENGFPVSPETALAWKQAERYWLSHQGKAFEAFQATFFNGDRAPAAGEIWCSPAHGTTLRAIAKSGGADFYTGALATQIANFAAATGGLLTAADLAAHQAEWVTPISVDYRGYTVWELPPNGQGIAALMALNLLAGFELKDYPRESINVYHWQIEAMKLAFADTHRYVADPETMRVTTAQLLSQKYAEKRRKLIGDRALPLVEPGLPQGGTVYLATAEPDLMVSLIQSNYKGFGSGILIPQTGIALHNRGCGFTLAANHPNQLAPGKRPFHTIIPGFLCQNGQPLGPFGVMGGPMQPQGHLQVVSNLVDYGMNPQTALDAPRWQFIRDRQVLLERSVPDFVRQGLEQRGHNTQIGNFFGRGQVILRKSGILIAASEPRADGIALAW